MKLTYGKLIKKQIEKKKISEKELIDKMKVSFFILHALIGEFITIDDNIAEKLSQNLGKSKQYWINSNRRDL